MLYYITGNSDKIQSAKNHLEKYKIKFEPKKLSLVEIQSDSIEEIARSKAKQAFDKIKEPLFVNDAGWFIPTLNGFPGAYVKFVCECFNPEDWINLMKDKKDKRIFLIEYVVYKDTNMEKSFTHKVERSFADTPYISKHHKYRFPSLDYVIQSQFKMTIAEHKERSIKSLPAKSLWDELGEFLNSSKY